MNGATFRRDVMPGLIAWGIFAIYLVPLTAIGVYKIFRG